MSRHPFARDEGETGGGAARSRSRRVASIAFAIAMLAVEGVILAESYRGLAGFADMIGIHGVAALGVPISLDGVSLAAAMVALRAELAGEASGVYRATMFAFTGASAAANWYHGMRLGGAASALYLGGMSLAVAWVFALSLRQIRHESRRDAGITAPRLPRFSLAHWMRYPRLTFRAFSLAVRDGHSSALAALNAAHDAASPADSHDATRRRDYATGLLDGLSQADAIRRAIAEVGGEPRQVVEWLAEHGREVAPQRVYDVIRRDGGKHRALRAVESGETIESAS